MPNEIADRFRRWFEYEQDSHARVMASLHAVPEALRSKTEFRKAVSLGAHLVAARRLWLFRMGAAKQGPGPNDFFPEGVTLSDLAVRLDDMHAAWERFLAGLDDEALARVFEYRSFDGLGFRNTVADILTQLFGHSSYHRGQIALLLRSIGAEPAVTDFVFWTREEIERPGRAG